MKYVYGDKTINMPLEYFVQPPTVTKDSVCVVTKQLARQFCPGKYAEYFVSKMRPDSCAVHTHAHWKDFEDRSGIINY